MEISKKRKVAQNIFGLGNISISHCDKFMAYSLDLKGSEYYTIYLRNLQNNQNENDIINNTSGSITWSLDSKVFTIQN